MKIRSWLAKNNIATSQKERESSDQFYVDMSANWQSPIKSNQSKQSVSDSTIVEIDENPAIPILTLTVDKPQGSLAARKCDGYDPYDTGQFDSSNMDAPRSK